MNNLYRELVITGIRRALNESDAANNYDNKVLKGRAREIFVSNLLRPYLNPTMGICTGIVIDSKGGHSQQIDVIVFDRNVISPSMLCEGEGIIPYESVVATVEVKSKLTSSELRKSICNARSVKILDPSFAEMRRGEGTKNSPVSYVFSFGSDLKQESEYERLIHLVDESNEDTDVKVFVPLSGICISTRYFIHCKNAAAAPPEFSVLESKQDYDAVLEFLVHLIDSANHLSLQRERIFFRKYLLEDDV
jgi:hypothetical protein